MDSGNILEKIQTAGLKFLVPLTLEETYQTIVQEAIKLIDAEYGSILLEENNEWKRVYSSSKLADKTESRKKGNTYKAFTQNKVIIADIKETAKFHPELKKQGVKSSIYIPLIYKDKAIGVLSVNAKKKIEQTDSELKTLKLFGSMATLVIRKAQLYKETQDALETRDFFISLASHELRTPLTSINGYIQLLHSRMAKKNTVESKWVTELYSESKRLTNLIQELLEINRIKQGTLQFVLRECELLKIIKEAIEKSSNIYPNRKIEFHPASSYKSAPIVADFEKLLQVIMSIIANSTKFSPEESIIKVSLSKKLGNYHLQVIDKGQGMDRRDIMKVFEGFYKAESHVKEGIGVGLMLAKHIIKYHRGTIEIFSEKKKGTIVQITLPIAE